VRDAQAAWSRWAVGLQWLVLAGEALGLQSIDFRPWKLLEEALRPSFAGAPLKTLLAQLERELKKKDKGSAEAVSQLAAALQQRAAQVWGGAEAAAEQLAELAAAEAGEEEEEEEDVEEEEDGQEAEGSGQQQGQQARQEEQQAQEQEAAEAPTGKKQKRDVFHSKTSRKLALLANTAKKAAKKASSTAAAAATKAAAPGAWLAAWLGSALRTLLAEPPTKLPGAAVFTCKDAAALEGLTAEPRAALHLALTEPHHLLPELPQDLGVAPGQEDASLTYRLFDQDPACANLADWYETYAAVYAPAAGPSSAGKKRKAAVKGVKGKRKAAADAGAGEGGADGASGSGASGSGPAAATDEAAALQRELAARFSQATADLQYVGLIKPAKRRRGDYVQRMVHMPASGL
jgi:chemotaxis protein histidine kinase CheA